MRFAVKSGQGLPAHDETERVSSVQEQQSSSGFVLLSDMNTTVEPDVRSIVVMAAVNMAGFDYETGGQPLSPARVALREQLSRMDGQLKQKLVAFYKSHRRPGVDEVSDAFRYEALSFMMAPPPSFSIDVETTKVPADLEPLLDFIPLVEEFYLKSGIKQLVPTFLKVGEVYSKAYRQTVGESIYETVNFFHAKPATLINMKPLVIDVPDQLRKTEKVVTRTRTRFLFVVPDPFLPIGVSFVRDDLLNQKEDVVFRRVGDDYIVVLGPARVLGKDALREALIRFVVDPMLERHLKTSLGFKDSIAKLVASVPGAAKPYSASVYLVMRESLAVAAEARIRRNEALEHGRPYSEDDVVYDLAQAYQRGAVLSFHFYDSLTGYQQVGIDLDDFIDQMLASTDFVREAARPKEFGPVLPRVEAARSRAAGAPSRSGGSVEPAAGDINSKVMESDFLIRQRKYSEAKPMLEQVLSKTPDNARALYGMAQVVNQMPSQVESDPNADENDKIQAQHDRLEKAIKLYREAIQKADPGSENWIVQWSHVLIARILDFQEFRTDALAEYNKAVEMGEVPSGAYKEAVEGKQHPFGQK